MNSAIMQIRFKIYTLFLILWATSLSVFAVDVNLDFYADGKLIHSVEVAAGSTYTLSTYVDGDTVSACRGWEFAGWTLDAPIEGTSDVKPCFVTSVTPAANMNIYGVYRKEKGTEYKFIKISGQDALVSGDYIITYADGDDNYYALGKTEYLYSSASQKNYYAIKAKQITDISCDFTEIYGSQPDSLIWSYTKSTDNSGTWYNANGSSYLKPDSARTGNAWQGYTYNFRVTGTSTVLLSKYSEDRGKFGIYAKNNSITNSLYYTSGIFRCMHRENSTYFPVFHLFKKTQVTSYDYTSYPDCSNWSVSLDAGLGTIGVTSNHTATVSEATPGASITLPTATQGDEFDCGDWSFHGWHRDTPVESTINVPTVYTGSGYDISYDGEQLYAVYTRTVEYIRYEQISSLSQLSNGDVCLIVYTGNSYAVTYNNNNSSWAGTSVTITDDVIASAGITSQMQWTYYQTDNYFYCGTNNDTYRLAYDGSTNEAYNPVDQGSSIFKFQNKGYTSYKLRWSGSNFAENRNNDNQNTFKIFVRKTTATTYTSFPHCRPYSITLHAGSGTIDVSGNPESLNMTEEEQGAGFELPDAIPGCESQGWSFVGWVEDSPIGSMRQTTFTSTDGLVATDPYIPSKNGTHLYAVYARLTDYFRIVTAEDHLVAGDNYIMTYYAKISGDDTNLWDVEISSDTYDANHLSGVPKDAPQDANGYYMIATDSAVIWRLGGSTNAWTLWNLKTEAYLSSGYTNNQDYTRTNATASTYSITTDDWINIRLRDNTRSYYLSYDGSKFIGPSSQPTNYNYLYRQMREYATYPRCEMFTVLFDGCGGTAGYDSKTETEVDGGIILPFAFVNNDCSKDDWAFAGWSETPIESETDVLTLDLLPPGIHFQPTKNNATLYAVYCRKENSYAKISSLDDLRLGLSYIIATDGNKALKALAKNTNYTDYANVTPSDGVITIADNANSIEWRIQGGHGEYEFFNIQDSLFLDMRTAGQANLIYQEATDNFLITGSSGSFKVRSNMSIVSKDGKKYLHFDGTNNRFDNETTDNASTIYLYQQQASYNSYPLCLEPIEPLRWTGDNHVVMESYVLSGAPRLSGGIGAASFQSDEGTYCLEYNPSVLTPGSTATVSWGDKHAALHIPYLVTTDTDASTLGDADCTDCDFVILPGATLTVDANKTAHDITIYEGGTLHIDNGDTLNVHALIMRRDDEAYAPQVTFGNSSSAINLQFDEIYYDLRIDEERYYWFSLPFNAFVQEVSYANITANGRDAEYRKDYFVKYYNGFKRADDADWGKQAKSYWTHVADKAKNAELQAGQGYEIGIYNQKDSVYNNQGYSHTKRVMRFTMRPNDARWNTQEINSTKVTNIAPSTCWHPKNAVHAGWNLIGNPYLHNYSTGDVDGSCGLVNGQWVKEMENGVWTGYYVLEDGTADVPYITVYDSKAKAGQHYSQCRAANYTLKPFDVIFVQINEGNQIYFSETMHSADRVPAYKNVNTVESPLYTGVTLSGNGTTDRTGIVLADYFTAEYEIGADLSKMTNTGCLNLYTLNTLNQELAFNALPYDEAATPIPVGATFPEEGVYTFAFDAEQYSLMPLQELLLIDYLENTTTNLLYADYEFFASKGTNNNRFAIVIRLAESDQTPTGIDDSLENGESNNGKFIKNGQLFIRKNNRLYNAIGAQL